MSNKKREVIEGYIMDIICLRKNSPSQYSDQAREHSTSCALMGHCVESGYGLVGAGNMLTLLDPKATPQVVSLLQKTDKKNGVRLRVEREENSSEFETVKVSLV